jgi:hypothetical protein
VVASAAINRTNLVVAGVSLIAAPALAAWWLLVLGLGAVAMLVAWKLASPSFWRRALAEAAGAHLPDPLQIADPSLRATVCAISHARGEVVRVLAETPPQVRAQVEVALPSLDELEHCAARLVRRADSLVQYLGTVKRERIEDEIDRLSDLERRTLDEEAQREYARAKAARREQLCALEEVKRAYERASASLFRVVASLDGLPSRIVRLRLLDAQARDDLSADLDEELERMNGEIATAEQTLKGLLGRDPSSPSLGLLDSGSLALE